MSSPTPKTPEHSVPLAPAASNPNLRRAFTLPSRVLRPRASTTSPSPASADNIETLFTHTCNKIVSFSVTGPRSQPISFRRQSVDIDIDKAGTLPWKSTSERTLAVGPLRIYRVTTSNVSFLNSGSLLHTIFPKSQCWCVDAESKFVLRIRQDSYYRIELPCESEQDREKLGEFIEVLDQVLQYEKTPCPFKRGFEVQLPERANTPPRKRPQQPLGRAKRWTFDRTWQPDTGLRPSTPTLEGSDSDSASDDEDDLIRTLHTLGNLARARSINTDKNPAVLESPRFEGMRAMTMPGMLAQQDRDVSDGAEDGSRQSSETTSLMSSTDSFHTALPTPSPPYMDAQVNLFNPWEEQHSSRAGRKEQQRRGRSRHRRYSEATVRPPSSDSSAAPVSRARVNEVRHSTAPAIDVHMSSAPSTPPLISDTEEDCPPTLDVPTPPEHIRMRRLTGASQRRAFSPMPHPQNLFLPRTSSGPGKQLTAALIRKTYELVLGPPHHLVTLMLRIAAKIKNGAFGFTTYRVRQHGDKIPRSWGSSDDEDEWSEDDFGIPLRNLESSTLRKRGCSSGVD